MAWRIVNALKNSTSQVNTGTDALDEVYEKFKHLDQCLSDTEWCNSGTQAIYGIAGEMWRAIKQGKDR
jgi:hypothetical protein